MIFLDTNVFLFAAGAEHPLREASQRILRRVAQDELDATTSSEVVQEILYVLYRRGLAEAAQQIARNALLLIPDLLPVTRNDMEAACELLERYPKISTRDAVHAATMLNNGIKMIATSDGHFEGIQEIQRLSFAEVE
ncbi:MAG TPA: type II toxin-antitoxin system VapC family toxin [Thermoanaerobaculia bacterium]|nr:type II toxin-antitoxin system VapC family toxin [Thermoanaerobaculia bacterium]